MSSDWDEIKRLAADFQKVQLSSSSQKLSERNCIEIVTLLIEKKLIDVIYTNDGKEYLTSSQLESEIQDELYIHGGRINLVEVAKTLNVDLTRIEKIAEKICKESNQISFLLGQLIDEIYLKHIAGEINEKLAQSGELSVSTLTEQFDLPSEFLLKNVMEKYVGSIIQGRQDSKDDRFFFTQTYILRCKAKLRGALNGITRPTPVTAILSQCGVKERIFYNIFDDVSTKGTLTSRTTGSQYIPHIYTKTQTEWINTIYKREGYLEHDAVAGLGVSDPKSFIQRQLPKEKLTHLKKCTVGSRIIEQVESELDECISSGKFIDVSTVLPSIMSDDDIEQLLEIVLDPIKQKSILRVDTRVLTNKYLDELVKPCYQLITDNVKTSVESGKYQQYMAERQMSSNKNYDLDYGESKSDKREERRKKAATGKVGGGTQGRETKTKSTKKHYRAGGGKGGHGSDSEDEHDFNQKSKNDIGNVGGFELISIREIVKIIESSLENDDLGDLAKQIAQHFYPQLSKFALNQAQTVFEATLQNTNQSRRQTHAALQEKLNVLLGDIRLYEKGLKLLPPDMQSQLVKYLLKTVGTEVCNELALYIANESGLHFNETTLTSEQRNKIIQECAAEYKTSLLALNKALAGTSVEDFLSNTENALQACSMILKKIDKKKDRTIIHSHKLKLLDQLSQCNDPALILHLATLIIFTTATQNMIHVSGRHVSSILSFLRPHLPDEQNSILMQFHDLVLKVLAAAPDSDEIKECSEKLNDLTSVVKEIPKSYKKVGTTAVE